MAKKMHALKNFQRSKTPNINTHALGIHRYREAHMCHTDMPTHTFKFPNSFPLMIDDSFSQQENRIFRAELYKNSLNMFLE